MSETYVSMRDPGCRECNRTTSGDCGKHGPIITTIPSAALHAEAPRVPLYGGHIDADCEVYRGVGGMCTCETPEEKAERAKNREECERERDAAAAPSLDPSAAALREQIEQLVARWRKEAEALFANARDVEQSDPAFSVEMCCDAHLLRRCAVELESAAFCGLIPPPGAQG